MDILTKEQTRTLKAWDKLRPLGDVLPEFRPLPLFDVLIMKKVVVSISDGYIMRKAEGR
jgi:hypothetical protein